MKYREGDAVELRVKLASPPGAEAFVAGCVTYASTTNSHYIVDTEKHGRFAVSPDHEDLRDAKR